MAVQNGWRLCGKCQGILYMPGAPSICPAGGMHATEGSPPFVFDHDIQGDQMGWRWCSKCGVMFFAENTSSWCPAGGSHDWHGSGNYQVLRADAAGIQPGSTVPKWHWCNKCQGLFLTGNPNLGWCPAGGGHDYAGSGGYQVQHE
jgi:Zn finger protein HypA/HybF involved in hydrogenase expression